MVESVSIGMILGVPLGLSFGNVQACDSAVVFIVSSNL